jgi:hypothetical protein
MGLKGIFREMLSHQNYRPLGYDAEYSYSYSLYTPAAYKRPFSSFLRSLDYPPESSPRTIKVEAGRPSAT